MYQSKFKYATTILVVTYTFNVQVGSEGFFKRLFTKGVAVNQIRLIKDPKILVLKYQKNFQSEL